MLGPFSRTFHSLFLSSNPLNARSRSSPSMAIALFSSILPFSSRCRCSRNSRWISAYNPSLFFDGNRFVAFRMRRYRRSVERRDFDEVPPKFDMSSFFFFFFFLVVLRQSRFRHSYAILFVDIAFWVLRKTRKRKKKRHHFCAPHISFFCLSVFESKKEEDAEEEEEDDEREREQQQRRKSRPGRRP